MYVYDIYMNGLLAVELLSIPLLGDRGVWTGHHDLAHSWLGMPWGLHKHKLQKPTNTNSPGLHGPEKDKHKMFYKTNCINIPVD